MRDDHGKQSGTSHGEAPRDLSQRTAERDPWRRVKKHTSNVTEVDWASISLIYERSLRRDRCISVEWGNKEGGERELRIIWIRDKELDIGNTMRICRLNEGGYTENEHERDILPLPHHFIDP